jgi:hypothetical protein
MSYRRAKRPLDPDAVQAANEELWAAHPELNRRQLTMRPEDGDLRKEWMDAYVAAGGEVEEPKPPKAPGDPVVPCPTSQDPNITTVSGPKDLGCGGFDWKIWFDIPSEAGKDGWVIQEITATFDAKNADGSPDFQKTYHYWEAWEVKEGKKVTIWQDQGLDDNDDQYFTGSRPGTKGEITYVGKAKFHEGPLPPDFKKNNPDTIAGILDSTTKKPDFWDGSGTDHNIKATWDCTSDDKTSSVSGTAGDTEVDSTP